MNTIKYPFGAATHLTPAYAATVEVPVDNTLVIVEPAILTGNLTLNLDIDPELPEGSELLVKIKTTATETTTFGTGIDAPVITGVAGKTKTQAFRLVSGVYIATGASVQID